jgi:hypothetical protein
MATNSGSWDEINPLDLRRSSKSTNHHFCVDKAVATGTWAIGVLHHVRPEYGGPTVGEFRDLADYVADLRDRRDLWVDTVRGIACYIRKRWALTVNSSFDTGTATISVTVGVGLDYPCTVPLTLRTSIRDYYVKSMSEAGLPTSYSWLAVRLISRCSTTYYLMQEML